MSRIWLTSDTHFGHANIIKYSKRPFHSADEHDAVLIENINTYVAPNDTLYHLGDFCYRAEGAVEEYLRRIRCKNIHFISGNHDKAALAVRHLFKSCAMAADVKLHTAALGKVRIYMHHCACRVWFASHKGAWHAYGHSHHSLIDLPDSLSTDVGVDAVAMRAAGVPSGMRDLPEGKTLQEDYRPISLEEFADIMATKTYTPIDHHGRDKGVTT